MQCFSMKSLFEAQLLQKYSQKIQVNETGHEVNSVKIMRPLREVPS